MEKKLRKSPVVIALYVFAALALVYSCYLVGSTVSYINSYYSAYGMSAEAGETVTYVLQSVFQPLMTAVLLFAAAKILDAVRVLNPANYATDEEIALAKEQKKLAKAAKKEAKDVKADAEAEDASETIVFEEAVEAAEEAEDTTAEEATETAEEAEAEAEDPEEVKSEDATAEEAEKADEKAAEEK